MSEPSDSRAPGPAPAADAGPSPAETAAWRERALRQSRARRLSWILALILLVAVPLVFTISMVALTFQNRPVAVEAEPGGPPVALEARSWHMLGDVEYRLELTNESPSSLGHCRLVVNDRYGCELSRLFVRVSGWRTDRRQSDVLEPGQSVSVEISHELTNGLSLRDAEGQALPRGAVIETLTLETSAGPRRWRLE